MLHEQKVIEQTITDTHALYNGDCIETMKMLPDESIDFTVYSPPFAGLYIYSDSERDLGNSKTDEEFYQHYRYVADEVLRLTVPGRLCAVHCKDLPLYFGRDEAAGLKDFPGELIRIHSEAGWTYHSRVTIWKCPVVERERTNNNGLLHKTIMRDRSQVRQGMADYLIVFRKTPNDGGMLSAKPVGSGVGLTEYDGPIESDPRKHNSYHPSPNARQSLAQDDSINIWRRYAEPVWWDIAQMDVLNYRAARDVNDERHICPLQLGVIRRAVQLWTNHGDVVLSPFAGIGSEIAVSVGMGRKGVGIELKTGYYTQAVKNCAAAAAKIQQDEMPLLANMEPQQELDCEDDPE